ncbi:hypothetical protein HDV05_005361 [Chytridiales sp. JEL 0842]|nr:hypothetical protein HDV05_005361 [Chytridiales sp. JEL 0842]
MAAIKSILDYCLDHGLERTAQTIQEEAPALLAPRLEGKREVVGREMLMRLLDSHEFERALEFVNSDRMQASFDDLVYVIGKYIYISQAQRGDTVGAQETLMGDIKVHVEREMARGGGRAQWFSEDYRMLQELLIPSNASLQLNLAGNPYLTWNWDREISTFWKSASGQHVAGKTPLYAFALSAGFPEVEDISKSFLAGLNRGALEEKVEVIKLEEALEAFLFRKGCRELMSVNGPPSPDSRRVEKEAFTFETPARSHAKIQQPKMNKLEPKAAPQPTFEVREVPGSTSKQAKREISNPNLHVSQNTPHPPPPPKRISTPSESESREHAQISLSTSLTPEPTFDTRMDTKVGSVSKTTNASFNRPRSSVQGAMRRDGGSEDSRRSTRRETASAKSRSEADDFDKQSSGSYTAFNANAEIEKLMPPLPKQPGSADFALSTTCGPVVGSIRAIDVQCIPETGQIIAATSGGDDRADRMISLWDVRNGRLITQLDNGTHKPVLRLTFHPTKPNLLMTADMEFDVKLWDWEEGVVVRTWKKMHTRIIWKMTFIPGREDKAASCSGDQSLKMWDTSIDKSAVGSVHANEPFTSFVFCGDVAGQTLVASLAYSIRIYKMRTLTLLHTIQLSDLKINKTPITNVESHPDYDNYILLSCENQLRLFDLSSETMLKVYSARKLGSGTRVEGHFSPCGTFVYCGTWDTRSFSAVAPARRASVANMKGNADTELNPPSRERGSPEAIGVYVWRVASAHLERAEMRAMNEGSSKMPVTVCRWIKCVDNSKPGATVERKVLIAATTDRFIKTFM